ncbi:MAG TPA: radical SAM protein [Syntrophomonadaceae bacterium]|nr:radical SAM protein [Syntrophomonadaceae bacterium]
MSGCHNSNNDNPFSHLVKKHPCYNGQAHSKYGRIHLPVSPSCNIQCKFCRRGFNKYEKRPGVSRGIMTPEEALKNVSKALNLCPEITVVGIAGPGDTLASDRAIETFRLIHAEFPELIKCLSTNGLLLEEKAKRLVEVGVKTVTVTVNAVDTEIVQKVCSHIIYQGQVFTGSAAACGLLLAQLKGIKRAASLGMIIKVNAVLIPGVNDEHIGQIARVTASAGAVLMNVIPLIPQNQMEHLRPPSCEELNQARSTAEAYLPVFRHCQQCRADACGIPGSGIDLAGILYDDHPVQTFSHG